MTGWYRVVDGVRRRPMLDFGPWNFPDPREAAEDVARQMNDRDDASHGRRARHDDDGA